MTTKEQTTGAALPPSFESAAAAIAARCYEDRGFARRMRENPKATIEEMCGKKLPESLAIEVHGKRRQDVARAGFPSRGHRQAYR